MKTRSDAFQFEKELDWEKPAPGIRRHITFIINRLISSDNPALLFIITFIGQ